MGILFEKLLAQLLFWIYDFIDTIGAIFNLLTGTQAVKDKRTLLEIFVESAVPTKVILGLCIVAIIIAGVCMGVRIAKNVIKFKAGGEQTSNATIVKQGFYAVLSSVVCIFFVLMFISFSVGLLNMVNDIISPAENVTLSQNLFDLSVGTSYVIDEDTWVDRVIGYYYDENGNPVREKDPNSPDGLKYETDGDGNYIRDDNDDLIPVYIMQIERYHPYKLGDDGKPSLDSGWVNGTKESIQWSMTPDEVFGVHNKDFVGLFEQADQGYIVEPIVRLESFNFLTAYLVAIIMLISMFVLSVGLVKRIYDIIVLMISMPLVCGTIPLDDGARFRSWRETFMSKVLIAFGAVIALNVFFMLSNFIITDFSSTFEYLQTENILSPTAVTVFKMLLLLGGALCINGSQALIARILGTSADESREAMQSFAMIMSGVRMGAAGALGAGRVAMGAGRTLFGGTNRYGRQRTGIIPMLFRGGNAIGERVGGENYINSRGGAFVRALGRMGGHNANNSNNANAGAGAGAGSRTRVGITQPGAVNMRGSQNQSSQGSTGSPSGAEYKSQTPGRQSGAGSASHGMQAPRSINNINNTVAAAKKDAQSVRPTNGMRSPNNGGEKSSAYKDDKRSKR